MKRLKVLGAVGALITATVFAVAYTNPAAQAEIVPRNVDAPVYTFISAPDLFNGDMGDVRQLKTWHRGDPNSWSASHAESIDHIFDEFESYNADSVLVAGDLVEGHWGKDKQNTGVFGPTDTYKNKLRAITRAGDFYYGEWRERFNKRNMAMSDVHVAVGDHEIGDNPWTSKFKRKTVPTFKNVWSRNFTRRQDGARKYSNYPAGTQFADTAYATYLNPDLLLVTVDVFNSRNDKVSVNVRGGQLEWLQHVLGSADPATQIIVQGHAPVLEPVRLRGTSGLKIEDGKNSAFWKTLQAYDVDFYFSGEVHAPTATQKASGDVVQLVHGGLFAWGVTDFLVGRVHADGRMEIDMRRFKVIEVRAEPNLWHTAGSSAGYVELAKNSISVGTLTLDQGVITERTGLLKPYNP